MLLTADAILAAADVKSELVEVAEWGGSVRLAVMSGRARDDFMTATGGGVSVSAFQAKLLSLTLVDESGALLFTADQVEALQGKSKDVLDRLGALAMTLNGIGKKASEDIAKNSAAAPSGDSGSASPSNTESPSDNSSTSSTPPSSPNSSSTTS
jgi:hypothetical protein